MLKKNGWLVGQMACGWRRAQDDAMKWRKDFFQQEIPAPRVPCPAQALAQYLVWYEVDSKAAWVRKKFRGDTKKIFHTNKNHTTRNKTNHNGKLYATTSL